MKLADLRRFVDGLEEYDGDLELVVQDPDNLCRLLPVSMTSELVGWNEKGKWSTPSSECKKAMLMFINA